jgi:DNA-binding NarL/FixJ family response regulator
MDWWLEREHYADVLTPRQWELVDMVSRGLSNKEIGLLLGLQEGTVKAHLHNIYQKTGVSNRTALAWWGVHSGLFASRTPAAST